MLTSAKRHKHRKEILILSSLTEEVEEVKKAVEEELTFYYQARILSA